jgi:hypothetical protein
MACRFVFYGQRSALTIAVQSDKGLYIGFAWVYPCGGLREPNGPPRAGTQYFELEADAWQAIERVAFRFLNTPVTD